MQSYWFGDIGSQGFTAFHGDNHDMEERLLAITPAPGRVVPLDWSTATGAGVPDDHGEYIRKLREFCFYLAEKRIADLYRSRDAELLQMVRTLDEIDGVINLLTERAVEWHRVKNPGFTRKYAKIPRDKILPRLRKGGSMAFRQVISDIEHLSATRSALMKEVSVRADEVVPNCSALIGGLVAARLVSQAGSLAVLSRLPGSSIQVLGARTALFSHMRGGTPPPKHGIIFQHRRVHNAPQEVRGKVARVLAAKLAIAARLDYYRQEPVEDFIRKAQETVDNAGRSG